MTSELYLSRSALSRLKHKALLYLPEELGNLALVSAAASMGFEQGIECLR
ncbi:MAG TPA: hypothetical protein VLI39_07390 [Sedimentisphaerales bacterium]|nr:hypothetical protein [Sedimentisphaerales bacterium]